MVVPGVGGGEENLSPSSEGRLLFKEIAPSCWLAKSNMDPSIPIPSSSSEATKGALTKCSSPAGSWLGKIRPTLANEDSLIKSGYLTSDKAALERTPKHTLSASDMCGFESRKPSILIQGRGKQ